jgi:hypothetical protein
MSLETNANTLGLRAYRTRQEIARLTGMMESDERDLNRLLDLIYAGEAFGVHDL